MNNHTPGPWKIHTESGLHGEYTIYTGNSREDADAIICGVAGGLGVHEEGCCESDANAHLISKAPEMFEALQTLATVKGDVTIHDGVAWLPDGTTIDLLVLVESAGGVK